MAYCWNTLIYACPSVVVLRCKVLCNTYTVFIWNLLEPNQTANLTTLDDTCPLRVEFMEGSCLKFDFFTFKMKCDHPNA